MNRIVFSLFVVIFSQIQSKLSSRAMLTTVVPSGLCAVVKPKGLSSNQVVSAIKYTLRNGAQDIIKTKCAVKVGHGGTLDPMAEGVLVLGIGKGTTLMGSYLNGSKGYIAKGLFGSETDTLDATGAITETLDFSHISNAQIDSILGQYRGQIMQIPPMYSALKRNGQPLYELARSGVTVEREPRPVTVYMLEQLLTKQDGNLPEFSLNIECSGGFYVRSLVSDIGRSLNSRAHMTALVRTKQGPFTLADCLEQPSWDFVSICKHIQYCSAKAGLLDLAPAVRGSE